MHGRAKGLGRQLSKQLSKQLTQLLAQPTAPNARSTVGSGADPKELLHGYLADAKCSWSCFCQRKTFQTYQKEWFKVLRKWHTTGEMHLPLLVFTLSSLAEAALRSGSRSLRAASASSESGPKTEGRPA